MGHIEFTFMALCSVSLQGSITRQMYCLLVLSRYCLALSMIWRSRERGKDGGRERGRDIKMRREVDRESGRKGEI